MTITKKMGLLVTASVLGIVILAGVAIHQMGKVFDAANFGNSSSVPSYQTLGAANTAFGNLRALVWQHMAVTDASALAEIDAKIATARQKLEESLAKYDKEYVVDEKDRALSAAVRTAFKDYNGVVDKALAEARANRPEQARDHLLKNQAVIARMVDAFQELRDYNAELADRGAKEAVAAKSTAITVAIVIVLLSSAAVTAIGFAVIRNVMAQLGGEPDAAAGIAQQIADGDLSSRIELKAGDTSSLMASMKQMSSALQSLLAEMNHMSREHDAGDIDVKIDETKFKGEYATMAKGVNDMVFGHIAVKKKAMACAKAFGEGDLDAPLEA
ncbi:MAG: MCP four helix bundle domain-containing protein, partial [Actinomycetota bacterium]